MKYRIQKPRHKVFWLAYQLIAAIMFLVIAGIGFSMAAKSVLLAALFLVIGLLATVLFLEWKYGG